mmetsp:Transcript_12398/g.22307  ORF Transcript_12398/g.22307 Transcript_12398/m.22307 type:complete len:238 (-) Transcript_12398:68-781(-)
MASADDKRRLIKLARQGKLEGDDGFRNRLLELVKNGCTGPGRQYGLDYCDKPFFRPALWEASWKNHDAVVKLLVDKGATIDIADHEGRTPLHEAAYYGHMNLVEYFLDKGHAIDCLDNYHQTPLFRAAEAGREKVVEFLVKRKADTNLLDSDACTVQHVATFKGMPDVGRWLHYKGAWKNRFSIADSGPVLETAAHAPEAAEPDSPLAPPTAEEPEPSDAGDPDSPKSVSTRPKFSD